MHLVICVTVVQNVHQDEEVRQLQQELRDLRERVVQRDNQIEELLDEKERVLQEEHVLEERFDAAHEGDAQTRPWLVIAIPSTPRRGDADYLGPTLDFIAQQLPESSDDTSLYYNRVLVVVMNNGREKYHRAFANAADRFDSVKHPQGGFFRFVTNGKPRSVPADVRESSNPNVPGPRVQQQTQDVVALMQWVEKHVTPFPAMYMLMEDDFRMCPHALKALQYLSERAHELDRRWIMLRVCYGLNGAVIQGADVPVLRAYLDKHHRRRPPDHLMVEWYAGETSESAAFKGTRRHFTFRYNLLEHFGKISSLRGKMSEKFAGCYDSMSDGVLFDVEAFKEHECGHDDVWPCPPPVSTKNSQGMTRLPPLGWGELRSKIRRVEI